MAEIIYNNDRRYPGPKVHFAPAFIKGLPTQEELDAYTRMFTWGDLKEIFKAGDLERLMRNKSLQARFEEWTAGMKAQYGSTENFLNRARLPWAAPDPSSEPSPTYDLSSSPTSSTILTGNPPSSAPVPAKPLTHLMPSTDPDSKSSAQPTSSGDLLGKATKKAFDVMDASHAATPGSVNSGASTPTSAGFVSLASLKAVNKRLRSKPTSKRGTPLDSATPTQPQSTTAATSGNTGELKGAGEDSRLSEEEDEPEDIPHYLKWDPAIGLDTEKFAILPNDWPYNIPYGVRHYVIWSRMPIAHPELVDYDPDQWSRIEEEGLGGFTGVTPIKPFQPPSSSEAGGSGQAKPPWGGRAKFIGHLENKDWYAADIAYAGKEAKEWAGVEYECVGGKEVGKMVAGLWDPRGWECLWFVNPPRLQSIPGFSHFHVLARRKTPEEIDAAEALFDETT